MAAARFTPAHVLPVAASRTQVGFASGAACFAVTAILPVAPEQAVPWLIPLPLVGSATAALAEPTLWG